mmetsp:Transcript_3578/g.4867  ORF Transcript_3578/g.4867 Transcript_3578/m.4867 type:complete len:293 (+) Transcript_3578:105-983(+)
MATSTLEQPKKNVGSHSAVSQAKGGKKEDSKMWTKAVVSTSRVLSPTVKSLTLKAPNTFKFHPGQWVDFLIPHLDVIGGYSFTSTPKLLQSKGTLELAVKISKHPAASWIHDKCKQGDEVLIKSGGNFKLKGGQIDGENSISTSPAPVHHVFIAGGIGITPFISMIRSIREGNGQELKEGGEENKTQSVEGCTLFYSARTASELIYLDELKTLCDEDSVFTFTSTQKDDGWEGERGRIDGDKLTPLLCRSNKSTSEMIFYLCGPPSMTEDIRTLLQDTFKISKERILYEKWW